MSNQITALQKDTFRELLSIAACSASTSLSKLLGKKVQVSAPILHIAAIQDMPKFIKNPQEITTIILVETSQDMQGHLMIACDPASTLEILTILTGKKVHHIEVLDDYERSALCEVGNILTGSAISALNKFLNFEIKQSIPDLATDMVGALFNNLMAQIGVQDDTAIEFRMDFSVEGSHIKGSMMGIMSPQSTQRVMEAVSNKYQHIV